jgi:hypothetical protein
MLWSIFTAQGWSILGAHQQQIAGNSVPSAGAGPFDNRFQSSLPMSLMLSAAFAGHPGNFASDPKRTSKLSRNSCLGPRGGSSEATLERKLLPGVSYDCLRE